MEMPAHSEVLCDPSETMSGHSTLFHREVRKLPERQVYKKLMQQAKG